MPAAKWTWKQIENIYYKIPRQILPKCSSHNKLKSVYDDTN